MTKTDSPRRVCDDVEHLFLAVVNAELIYCQKCGEVRALAVPSWPSDHDILKAFVEHHEAEIAVLLSGRLA